MKKFLRVVYVSLMLSVLIGAEIVLMLILVRSLHKPEPPKTTYTCRSSNDGVVVICSLQ